MPARRSLSHQGHRPGPRSGAALCLSVPVALAAGVLVVAASLVGRIAVGGEATTGGWMAAAAPLAAVLVAAATAALLLHWSKVKARAALVWGAGIPALVAFALGQAARLVDAAAVATGPHHAADLMTAAPWARGLAWLDTGATAGWLHTLAHAPALAPLSRLVGQQAGWALPAIALAELFLAAAAVLFVSKRALGAPLCTACRRWCQRHRGVLTRSAGALPILIVERAEARDWLFFQRLGPAQAGSPRLRFDLARCPSCDRSNALSVSLVRPLGRERVLVRDLRLGPDDMRTVTYLGRDSAEPHPARPRRAAVLTR